MKQTIRLLKGSALQIYRDQMLLLLCVAPFLIGTVLRLLVPFADRLLIQYINFTLRPYFLMVDAFTLALSAMITGLMVGLLMLDERDDGICVYFGVTPVGGIAYLASRLVLPFFYSLLTSLIVISYAALGGLDYSVLILPAFLSALSAPLMGMLLFSIASNKVEGLAVSKLTGIILFGAPIAWFADSWLRLLGYLLPSFWPMEMLLQARSGNTAAYAFDFLAGSLCTAIWIFVLYRIFRRKMA